LLRDSGPHFQNNKINEFETEIYERYGKIFTVSAFAKRHGWNECDGAHSRFVKAIKAGSLEGRAPKDAKDAVTLINMHDKFPNCSAYYFTKIDRNAALFPDLTKFKGIQALQLCEFKYDWTDFDGQVKREPGWVMARPLSGIGAWVFHDYLPHTRPQEWGKRCAACSSKRGRAIFHKREGEPVKSCRQYIE
jgi:hypothetical protein